MESDVAQIGPIGILMGGCSSEREISLRSGQAVYEALKNYGCRVSAIDIACDDKKTIVSQLKDSKIAVAFIALHGRLGEDGTIQAILEELDIPYIGSGPKASRLAINKILSQNIFKQNNLPIPSHIAVRKGSAFDERSTFRTCGLPLIVKPASHGSSVGITLVEDKKNLRSALEAAFDYDEEVLVEHYIKGRELTVGIIGREALPIVEIHPKNNFFDFAAKYQAGITQYSVPANLPIEMTAKVQAIALKAYRVLGCRHFSRVDIMLDSRNNPYILEINTIPGFTSTSLLPKAAKAAGLDFVHLCLRLIGLALEPLEKKDRSFVFLSR